MIVLQISPRRMGSTWQFNTARELLNRHAGQPISFYLDDGENWDKFAAHETKNFLVKSHLLDIDTFTSLTKRHEVKVLISLRNIIDTVRSSRRVLVRDDSDTLQEISVSLGIIKRLISQGYPSHISLIDDLDLETALIKETEAISQFLGINVSKGDLKSIARGLTKEAIRTLISKELGLNSGFEEFDESTQWHGNHISPEIPGPRAQATESRQSSEDSECRPQQSHLPLTRLQDELGKVQELLLPHLNAKEELLLQRDELLAYQEEHLKSRLWKVSRLTRKLLRLPND